MKIKSKIVALLASVAFAGLSIYTMNAKEINNNSNEIGTDVIFDDITGNWAEEALNYFINLGLMETYEDGSMMPDTEVTRCEFITLVVNALKLNGEAEENFLDISEFDSFYKDIQAALANNIIDNEEEFRPYEFITAKEASEMLNKALNNGENIETPFIKECINKNSNYNPDDFITKSTTAYTLYGIIKKSNGLRSNESWMPQELEYLIEMGHIDTKWAKDLSENKNITKKEFVELATEVLEIEYDFKDFGLDDSIISREEVAMVLATLLQQRSTVDEKSQIEDVYTESILVFDEFDISEEYFKDVIYVLNNGIMNVNSACDFKPKSEVSKLEAIKALYNIKKSNEGKQH